MLNDSLDRVHFVRGAWLEHQITIFFCVFLIFQFFDFLGLALVLGALDIALLIPEVW